MNRLKNKNEVSTKVYNIKTAMKSLFTDNENKSISSILNDFKLNRSIQYLVDNIQPYIDTKVKLIFLHCLYEIIPSSHQERYYNYCSSKGLRFNKFGQNSFDFNNSPSFNQRAYNCNSYFDCDQIDGEAFDMFETKSSSSFRNDNILTKRKNPLNFASEYFNSRHLFICRLTRLSSQHCNKYELSLRIWGIEWWRSHSTYSIYITNVDDVTLYKRNNIYERDIQIGQRLKQINGRDASKMKDEEFIDILNNSMFLDLILQGKGVSSEDIWENVGNDYKWIDCVNDRICHPPLNYTICLDHSRLKPIELLKDVSQEIGINICGGKDYLLGIYISSIKPGSIGSMIGFQTGDKILQINSVSFTGSNTPCQAEAFSALHQCDSTDIWVYSTFKLPMTDKIQEPRSRSVGRSRRKDDMYSVLESKGMFHKGQRNQLTHTSLTQPSLGNLEIQLSEFTSKQDVNKILFLLEKYSNTELNVHQLVTAIQHHIHGIWTMKLINLISNTLRVNDRMTFKMKLEVIQALREEKASITTSRSAHQTPIFQRPNLTENVGENDEISVIRRPIFKKPEFSHQNSSNSEKDLPFKEQTMESLDCEFQEKPSLFDEIRKINKDNKKEILEETENTIKEKRQTMKESQNLEKNVDIEDEEIKVISRKTISTPKEYISMQYNIPKEEIIKLAGNKLKKLVTVPKAVPMLGISIEGGINTPHPLARITKVDPDSCAGLCGEMSRGDIILEVNGIPLTGMEHNKIAQKIAESFKSLSTDPITFLLMKSNSEKIDESDCIDYQSTYL